MGRSFVSVLPLAALVGVAVVSLSVAALHPWAPLLICGALGLAMAMPRSRMRG
jgi:hypothetical protein